MQITVIGCGYLGVTQAACWAARGHQVLGVDLDEDRILALQNADLPFYEPGLAALLRTGVGQGRLSFTTSYMQAVNFANVHFLTVGTPEKTDGTGTDISAVIASVEKLAALGASLIIGRSTVPVGTAAKLQQAHPGVEIAWQPEFLREGQAVADCLHPDRIVIGCAPDSQVPELIRALNPADTPLIVTDLATAELAKTSANAFLATKISFINAISELCEKSGADVRTLAQILGLDPRIGSGNLAAGLGFGGGCLPKDLRGLLATAAKTRTTSVSHLLQQVDGINQQQQYRLAQRILALCAPDQPSLGQAGLGQVGLGHSQLGVDQPGHGKRPKIAILGATFKPHTDDTRDAPALKLADYLTAGGAEVVIADPKIFPDITVEQALYQSDITVLATEWPQYQNLDPVRIQKLVRRAVLFDCRNVIDVAAWRKAGWLCHGVGW